MQASQLRISLIAAILGGALVAAVMVLLDDSFASIAAAVELGRSVYANIRKFLIYLFSHNIGELVPRLSSDDPRCGAGVTGTTLIGNCSVGA